MYKQIIILKIGKHLILNSITLTGKTINKFYCTLYLIS